MPCQRYILKLNDAVKSNQEGLFRAIYWIGVTVSFSSADLRYPLPSLLYYREWCLVKIFL